MKKRFLLVLTVLLAFCLSVGGESLVSAASWPETVRIGLYYGSSTVANVSFQSRAGLEIGSFRNDAFQSILTIQGGSSVIIRRDSFFIKSPGGTISVYNPAEGKPFEGETLGPYHIQIGGSVAGYPDAKASADLYKQFGVTAYPVFEDGWYVWAGFYPDAETANQELKKLADTLGTGNLKLISPSNARLVVQSSLAEPLLVFSDGQYKLRVRPLPANNPPVLAVNGKQYRGEFEIRRYPDSDLTVINILNIEEYLYGVVPQELEHTAPLEALKAQAVAARTYTYRNLGKYSKWGFDLTNTVSDQVYAGYDGEKTTTNMAVDQTKGKKILYNGSPISVFYFSSSGGRTEDSENVWGTPIAYLRSVPDPYESGDSYNYSWSKTFTAEDLRQILFLSSDVDLGAIQSVTIEEVSAAGRPIKVKFVGTKGQITYYRQDARTVLGLPSNYYTISSGSGSSAGTGTGSSGGGSSASRTVYAINGDGSVRKVDLPGSVAITASGKTVIGGSGSVYAVTGSGVSVISGSGSGSGSFTTGLVEVKGNVYVFTGKGWGHGVGMSQEGAKGFARMGYTYDQILKHYFTGVTIE